MTNAFSLTKVINDATYSLIKHMTNNENNSVTKPCVNCHERRAQKPDCHTTVIFNTTFVNSNMMN